MEIGKTALNAVVIVVVGDSCDELATLPGGVHPDPAPVISQTLKVVVLGAVCERVNVPARVLQSVGVESTAIVEAVIQALKDSH